MTSLGTRAKGSTIYGMFNTTDAVGAPITIGGTAAAQVYQDANLTQITSGITVTEDYDGVTGLHQIAVDTSGSGFTAGSDYWVVISVGTADSVSIVGAAIFHFFLEPKRQIFGSVAASPAPSTTVFKGTFVENVPTSSLIGMQCTLHRLSGGIPERQRVTGCTNVTATTATITVGSAFSSAPASGDLVKIE